MKKSIFFLILLLFLGLDLSAQSKKIIRYGIKAGINLTHFNFSKGSPPPENPINSQQQTGFLAGIVAVVPLSGNLYFRPEYLFSQVRGKIERENTQYVVNYASFPVLLHWQFLNRFSIVAGPHFDLLINASEKKGNTTSLEHKMEHRSVGITAGVEYLFTPDVMFGLQYIHGVNNIGVTTEIDYRAFKYENMQLSLSYLF